MGNGATSPAINVIGGSMCRFSRHLWRLSHVQNDSILVAWFVNEYWLPDRVEPVDDETKTRPANVMNSPFRVACYINMHRPNLCHCTDLTRCFSSPWRNADGDQRTFSVNRNCSHSMFGSRSYTQVYVRSSFYRLRIRPWPTVTVYKCTQIYHPVWIYCRGQLIWHQCAELHISKFQVDKSCQTSFNACYGGSVH
jgi:hypothetical protein